MMDWDKTRATFRTMFEDVRTAGIINIGVPVPEADWEYLVTLEDDDSLLMIIKGDFIQKSSESGWLHFGSYEARELAAILLGFADASDARKGGESQ